MALEIKEYVGNGNMKTVNETSGGVKKKKAVKTASKKTPKKTSK